MTPEQVIEAIPGRVVIHAGSVLFNTHDILVAEKWSDLGATVRPWYAKWELDRARRLGDSLPQGWEVQVLGVCGRVEVEDVDGDLVDVTRDVLLAAAREHRMRNFRVPA